MNIGKAASLSGLTVKTVRYYSDIGIIKPDVDTYTGYRDFSEPDLAKLQFVAKARKFDFSLDDSSLLTISTQLGSCAKYALPFA